MRKGAFYKWPKPPPCTNPPHHWKLDDQSKGKCSRCKMTFDFRPPAGAFNWTRIVPGENAPGYAA